MAEDAAATTDDRTSIKVSKRLRDKLHELSEGRTMEDTLSRLVAAEEARKARARRTWAEMQAAARADVESVARAEQWADRVLAQATARAAAKGEAAE